jgi:hypothetical protein
MRERKREAQWGMGQKMENGPDRGQKKNEADKWGRGDKAKDKQIHRDQPMGVGNRGNGEWGMREGVREEDAKICARQKTSTLGQESRGKFLTTHLTAGGEGEGEKGGREEEPNCDEQAKDQGGWRRGRTTYVL